jgi:glycosyltransferase involved in cell wall biosynthesis
MTLPTWSHCIPTLDRLDILEQAVRLSLDQTCPPLEIIIVDVSKTFDLHKTRIEALVAAHPGPRPALHYLSCPVRSLTVQRNLAIKQATGDILFLFDDDSLMHPDCAERILQTYAADPDGRISAVAAMHTNGPPGAAPIAVAARAEANRGLRDRLAAWVPHRVSSWMVDNLLMLGLENRFVPYDAARYPALPQLDPRLTDAGVLPLRLISGFRLTVRRSVALKELFDDFLLAYSPAEDLDASYRFLRHGVNVTATTALVYHHQAAANRLKRRSVAELSLLNIAYFVRRSSRTQALHQSLFLVLALRLLLSCALRDTVGRRWAYPDTRGTLAAMRKAITVFRLPPSSLGPVYQTLQLQILATSTPTSGTAP